MAKIRSGSREEGLAAEPHSPAWWRGGYVERRVEEGPDRAVRRRGGVAFRRRDLHPEPMPTCSWEPSRGAPPALRRLERVPDQCSNLGVLVLHHRPRLRSLPACSHIRSPRMIANMKCSPSINRWEEPGSVTTNSRRPPACRRLCRRRALRRSPARQRPSRILEAHRRGRVSLIVLAGEAQSPGSRRRSHTAGPRSQRELWPLLEVGHLVERRRRHDLTCAQCPEPPGKAHRVRRHVGLGGLGGHAGERRERYPPPHRTCRRGHRRHRHRFGRALVGLIDQAFVPFAVRTPLRSTSATGRPVTCSMIKPSSR